MPAFLATVTYSSIVFGDDEDDARASAPDVIRALSTSPIHIEIESLEQDSPGTGTSPATNPGAHQ